MEDGGKGIQAGLRAQCDIRQGAAQVWSGAQHGYHDGGIDKYLEVAAKALAMPKSYRIDGKVVRASGYQHNPRYTAIGAANRHLNWYRGAIADLKIKLK